MAQPPPLSDLDAGSDPHLEEYQRAVAMLRTSDWADGMDQLERLAHDGSIMSMLMIGDALRDGWIYAQDLPRAEGWYEAAVKSGSVRARYGLGITHLLMDRFAEAIQDLELAVADNFPPAYNALAGIYFRGDGVPVDRQRALELWRKWASLGHLLAKENLIHQSLHGRFGFGARVTALLQAVPFAFELARVRTLTPHTDRLR